MATFKYDQASVIVENLLFINETSCGGVRRISQVDSCRKVDCHKTTHIVERIIAERVDQSSAVHLVYVTQRIIEVYIFFNASVVLLVSKVDGIQAPCLDCFFDVIILERVAL